MDKQNERFSLTIFAKILIAVALIGVVILAQFVLWPLLGFVRDREMVIASTGHVLTYAFDSGAEFHSNDSRFFHFATRDGIRFIGSNEVLMWSESFSFNHPSLSTRGDFVAIGERSGGRNIHVFNSAGPVFSVSLDIPIQTFWINETGFLSVIAEYDHGYIVYVFNQYKSTAEDPFFSWLIFYDLIVPTHADVSSDGRYVAIGVMDLTFNVRQSVQFRYTNQWDAWGTDRGHFATEDFPGQVITAMQFMEGNRLVVSTTSQIAGFQLGPSPAASRPIWDIQFENEKDDIAFYGGTHFAFTTGSRLPMATGEGDPVGTLRIYSASNGAPTGVFEFGRRATHLHMGHNSVIVGGDRNFRAVSLRGVPLWEHTTHFDVRDVLFLDDTNTIMVVGSNRAEIFERRRLREADFFREEDFDEYVLPIISGEYEYEYEE